jgi:hypothetical protein
MKTNNGLIVLTVAAVLMSGCAGNVDYIRPTSQARPSNSVTINLPKDNVWNAAIPKLGSQFFVINNLDKSSGLINLSYSGDPEKYVDCGIIETDVIGQNGEILNSFPASKAYQRKEIALFSILRKMSLEGRINLIFEEISPNQTRVIANAKYVIARTITLQGDMGATPRTENVSFNSSGSAFLDNDFNRITVECMPSGKLESEILRAIERL